MLLAQLPRTSFISHSSVKLSVISMWPSCGAVVSSSGTWHCNILSRDGASVQAGVPPWTVVSLLLGYIEPPARTLTTAPLRHCTTAAPPTLSRDFCCLFIGATVKKQECSAERQALQEELLPLQMNTELPRKDEHKPTGSLSTDCWSVLLLSFRV